MTPVSEPAGANTSGLPSTVVLRGLHRQFGSRKVLRGVDLSLRCGEFVALLGPSGCGKSTLLRQLAALDQPDAGSVQVPARVGVVFQDARLLPWRRVWQNVVMGVGRDQHRAHAALAEVGLQARAEDWPGTLSGGEAQRVALARALVREPELLLLDEPFAALDALTRLRMHALVLALWRQHQPTVLMVTHDVDEALLLADRVLVMREGHIVRDQPLDAARPRDRTTAEFEQLRRQLLVELGLEASSVHAPA
ncbi:ABC transporter ATP-binding protein [Xenophilus sp. Marseille-Q4582]|uniref:ABC transporter ATP-binding protein n=1 Tax=Xenophilus sp. Marseille-Q4582 TaxID=2866600 RepID=UPI00351D5903